MGPVPYHAVYMDYPHMSAEMKKKFMFEHIMNIVAMRQQPRYNRWDTGASVSEYYILGELPHGRYAIYMDGKIGVITGRDSRGFPQFEKGVSYSAQSLKRFFGRGVNVAERDLVLAVRVLIKQYKKDVQWKERI